MPTAEPDLSRLRLIFNRRREDAGMTFEQLAEASGLSRQTLLNILAGRYLGDLRTWLKLSRAFGVGLDVLLAEVWETDPGPR
ncbi:MAG: helix-turn-helix transcriptional regulator [Propionibacteriaceae bacterium]|jgi:putative transcriptional regulator|nr:helix-turn-helix transcriptional regulator [Propionibacteriaceae bacterium]